jgi:hypothetical protein
VRTRCADEPVAEVAARAANCGDLHILAVWIVELAIACSNFVFDPLDRQQWLTAGEGVHPRNQRRQIALDDEILALVHEGLHRAGNALSRAGQDLPPALAGQVGILFRTGQREFLLDDSPGQNEPGIIVAGVHDVAERAQRVEARIKRNRKAIATRVEPERGWAGQDANGVIGPDRGPVLDPLHVVPHAVAIDDGAASGLGDGQHAAVDVVGNAGDHELRRRAETLRPVAAHELVIGADAAGGDNDGLPLELERSDDFARALAAAFDVRRRQDVALHAVNGRPRFGQRFDTVTEFESQKSLPLGFTHALDKRSEDSRPGAPGHVKARHRVAVADSVVAAALSPADDRKETEAARVEP